MEITLFQQNLPGLNWLLTFLSEHLVGLLIGAMLGVGGTLFVDSRRAKRRRHEATRSLTSASQVVLNRLAVALDRFADARRTHPDALLSYFNHQDSVLTEKDDQELAEAKAAANVLPQPCLDTWGRALDKARRASRMHNSMRTLVGRPDAVDKLTQRAGGYRDQLRETLTEFRQALHRTRKQAPEDAQSVIDDLVREL